MRHDNDILQRGVAKDANSLSIFYGGASKALAAKEMLGVDDACISIYVQVNPTPDMTGDLCNIMKDRLLYNACRGLCRQHSLGSSIGNPGESITILIVMRLRMEPTPSPIMDALRTAELADTRTQLDAAQSATEESNPSKKSKSKRKAKAVRDSTLVDNNYISEPFSIMETRMEALKADSVQLWEKSAELRERVDALERDAAVAKELSEVTVRAGEGSTSID
ncbi:hypothetical protein BD779DRAFT_1679091 [Infundibulicybe gibba]|nr:hypothetical protein BD779DRAFT_1679091 [Infundibulicybe gibba]